MSPKGMYKMLLYLGLLLATTIRADLLCPSMCRCSLDDRGRKKVTCQRGGMRDSIPMHDISQDTQLLIITAPADLPNHLSLGPIFKGYQNLEEIHIMWSSVPIIGAHSFWGLSDLTILNLTHNSISTLMDTNFKGLSSLKHLDLSHNDIESIPSAVFRHVRHLHSLGLAHNKISGLVSRIFFGLTRLEHLDLSHNPIGELQSDLFSDVPALKKFHCANCHLAEIEEDIIRMIPEVKDLNLRDNFLQKIPLGLANLASLISIQLDGNRITQISEFTFTDSPVSHVHLAYNAITSIDSNAFSNCTVTHLDLSYNKLSDLISGGFTDVLPHLRDLQLSGNPLPSDQLFEMLFEATQLHHLGLGNIGLSEIPKIIGRGRGLHSLNFSSNYISVLPYELFTSSPHLRLLDISYNKFEGIGDDVLEVISSSKDLRVLKLEGNPWKCDQCHVAPLLRWLQRSPDQESGCEEPRVWTCLLCVEPDRIKGQSLALLPLGDLPKCTVLPTKASLSLSDPSIASASSPDEVLRSSGIAGGGGDQTSREYVDILDELKVAPPLADQPVYSRDGYATLDDEEFTAPREGKSNIWVIFAGIISFTVIFSLMSALAFLVLSKKSPLFRYNETSGKRTFRYFRKRPRRPPSPDLNRTLSNEDKHETCANEENKSKAQQEMTELKLDEKPVNEGVTKTPVIRETALV